MSATDTDLIDPEKTYYCRCVICGREVDVILGELVRPFGYFAKAARHPSQSDPHLNCRGSWKEVPEIYEEPEEKA